MSSRYRSRDEREMVAYAAERGWRCVARNAAGHLVLQHESGCRTQIPGSYHRRTVLNVRRRLAREAEGVA